MKKFLNNITLHLVITLTVISITFNSYCKPQNTKQDILNHISLKYSMYPLIKSKFVQVDTLGKEAHGWFIIDKSSGKARIEYISIPLRIIINNNSVMVEQIDLKEKSFSPLLSSPFKFIISDSIDLNSPNLNITNLVINSNNIHITIAPKQNSFRGLLTLYFNKQYLLTGWHLEDELGNKTNFTLFSTVYLKNKIPSSVFNTHRVTKVNYNDFK